MCIGLSLIMNIHQSEYTSEAGDLAGIVVVVKQQNVMPFPEDEGIILSAGHATVIGFTFVSIFSITACFVHLRNNAGRLLIYVLIKRAQYTISS